MAKASDFESEDWGFESLRGRLLLVASTICNRVVVGSSPVKCYQSLELAKNWIGSLDLESLVWLIIQPRQRRIYITKELNSVLIFLLFV